MGGLPRIAAGLKSRANKSETDLRRLTSPRRWTWLWLAWSFNSTLCATAQNIQIDLSLPEGFEVIEYAGPTLAPDIYSLAFDPKGRVVVSSKGYIRILEDSNTDGIADRYIQFATGPKDGAMGMLWEGDRLYFTGEEGLRYFEDKNCDNLADGPSVLVRPMNTGDEHGAHAIRRGPDGWLYTIGGNETRIDKTFAELDTSPIENPVAGCLIRFTPNLAHSEIVADGFRNAYDFDFNLEGDIFTFDSDNERCQSLPWYEPTRFYHVIEGGHYGWQNPQYANTWRRPPYFFDVVAPVATLGRGSPCGVECYRHRQFPEMYRGGFFVLDWTFGRVYFLPLKPTGATYTSAPLIFMAPEGHFGFAVTDLAIHPESGDLFISTGGRGTRGAVYRIRHLEGFKRLAETSVPPTPTQSNNLAWTPGLQPVLLSHAQSESASNRVKSLTAILRHSGQFEPERIEDTIRQNWDHADRYVRWKTSELIARMDESTRVNLFRLPRNATSEATLAWGVRINDPNASCQICRKVFTETDNPEIRLECVRLFQILLGDLTDPKEKATAHAGYSARNVEIIRRLTEREGSPENGFPGYRFLDTLQESFPTGLKDLDREISRTFAMVESEDSAMLEKVCNMFSAESDPVEDIHYLFVLSRLIGPRPQWITEKSAETFLRLDLKVAERGLNRESNWQARMSEAFENLSKNDPALAAALLDCPEFGSSEHTLYTRCEGFDRGRAARIFLRRVVESPDYYWTPDLISLLGALPAGEVIPLFRKKWSEWSLRRMILKAIVDHPEEADREKFLWGLTDTEAATQRRALTALKALKPSKDPLEIERVIRALRQVEREKESSELVNELIDYLRLLTGMNHLPGRSVDWAKWLREAYPNHADGSSGETTPARIAWTEKIAGIDWNSGSGDRGKAVADRLACTTCHAGTRALGPDLVGISGRFSRDDLLAAILQPSKDISSQYCATVIETAEGTRLQGLVVYDANDGLILQNGPDETFQVNGQAIVERSASNVSLMPEGLLEGLTDQEIADLLKYLGSL